jgi:hypothetical protein
MSGHPTNTLSCLNAASNPNNIELNNERALLTFDSIADSSAVQNALGVDFTATVGWGKFAVTTAYNYARSSEDDAYTLNMNYVYQLTSTASFKSGVLAQGNAALTPAALQLVSSDPVGFRNMCGDRFVSEMNAGASILMRISLKFDSHNEKDAFDDSFHAAGGLQDILTAIQNNNSGIHYTLSVSGVQVGGNPQLFNNLFTSFGGEVNSDGYPELQCSNGAAMHNTAISDNPENQNCTQIINQIIPYADTIKSQLNTNADYYMYNPVAEQFPALGIFPGAVEPDPATLQAMQDLSMQYNNDQNSLNFLNNYLHMLDVDGVLSAEMQNNLLALKLNYAQVLNIYHNPQNNVMNCYDGYVSSECVTIRDNIFKQRAQILNNDKLNTLLTYLTNNEYQASLINNTGSDAYTACSLYPVDDSNAKLFITNCDGQVSGTLDPLTGTTINYDQLNNLLYINNLNYSYKPLGGDLLNFSYSTPQPLIADPSYDNTWSGQSSILVNGNPFTTDTLTIVNSSH